MDRPTATAAFPSEAASVAAARGFVRRTLTDWGMEALADDAVLATSELATNAVAYAGTPFEVHCRADASGVRIELRDRHATRRFEMPGAEETRGRGLASTARLAGAWGVSYEADAKTVWFRLDAPDAPDSIDAPGPPDARDVTVSDATGVPGMPGREQPGAKPGATGAGRSPHSLPARARRRLSAEGDLDRAVDAACAELPADGAAVLLADAEGRFSTAAAAGLAAELEPAALRAGDLGPAGFTDPTEADPGAWIPSEGTPLPRVAGLVGAGSLAAVRLRADGGAAGVLIAVAADEGRFDRAAGARLARIADEVALRLERARVGELERSWRGWLSFVAEASDLLAGTLDQQRTMALVAQLAVPRLATWCAVYTVDEAGADRPAYVWHADETRVDALRGLLEQADPAPSAEVTGPWNGFRGAPAAARSAAGTLCTDLVYAFPLAARGRRIGVLLIGRPEGDRFPRGVIELAEELSRRAALAIDNARLYAAQTAMSSALQRSLLPPGLPEIPGLEVAVVYEPAGGRSEVGGDFYDLFAAPSAAGPGEDAKCWRFAIGDVCGTGPEAAAVTGLARHALRILAAEGMSVPDVLGRLNRLILDEGERSRLLTLLHGEITPLPDRGGVRLDLVSAGHPLPLMLGSDGTVREVAAPQRLLGVFEDVDFTADRVELTRGQVLLCVTDGVTERRAGERLLGDGRGLERVLSACGGLSAGAVAAAVQRAVRDFGPEPSNDDVALIVLRVP